MISACRLTNLTATIVITNGSPAIGGNVQLNLNSPGIQVVIDNLRVEFVPFAAVLTNALLINGADFQFTIHGSGSQVVLGNTNLVNPNGWIPLYTNTAPCVFTDTNALNRHREFYYRALAQ